ncbi:hypothetical protein FJ651_05985 [Paucihalobacter ruber]|uniref:Lipoprotein n=1 Tax=Paucihalobacter ruber TaxID=2567861 RepID=A0A506PMW3_9FLAO|nr:hypothetical protein [Paucihalobacter ruber]TPV35071.1 hypothetical protein FJ651_05985 [Paucihalobacter ruber]
MKNKFKIFLIVILVLGILVSCQPIFKLVTGVKNPKVYVSNQDRIEYYNPWIENKEAAILIKTIENQKSFVSVFQALEEVSFPIFIIEDIQNKKSYTVNCYEDFDYTVELLDQKKLDKLKETQLPILKLVDSLSNNFITKETFNKSKTTKQDGYHIRIVHGTFLGKKLRKRISGVFNSLDPISSITILDLSIDEDSKND